MDSQHTLFRYLNQPEHSSTLGSSVSPLADEAKKLTYYQKNRERMKEYRFKSKLKFNNLCIDCDKLISRSGKRCRSCFAVHYKQNYKIPIDSYKKRSERWLKEKIEKYKNITISKESEQVLIGSLLGDGCLHKSLTTQYKIGHCAIQRPYLDWKIKILNLPVRKIRLSKNNAFYYDTIFLPQLNYYHTLFYPNGKKIVTREILDKLESLGLAVWYMDDGCLTNKPRRLVICTNGFTYNENLIIKTYFEEKWGIIFGLDKLYSQLYNKTYYRIKLTQYNQIYKFLNIVKPFIHPCVQYKIDLKPLNEKPSLQERKEKKKEYMCLYRQINKEKIRLVAKRYRENNREKVLEWKKISYYRWKNAKKNNQIKN